MLTIDYEKVENKSFKHPTVDIEIFVICEPQQYHLIRHTV